MTKYLVLQFIVFSSVVCFSRNLQVIKYNIFHNNEISSDSLKLLYNDTCYKINTISSQNKIEGLLDEETYVVPKENKLYQLSSCHDKFFIIEDSIPSELQWTLQNESKEILGKKCYQYRVSYFSNTIDIWVFNNPELRVTPYPKLGLPKGVVLGVSYNGSTFLMADTIYNIESDSISFEWKNKNPKKVTRKELKKIKMDKVVKKIHIFKNEQLNFSDRNTLELDSVAPNIFCKGNVILKKIKFPKITDDYQIYLTLVQKSLGDAYDRTGSVFLIEDTCSSMLKALLEGKDSVPFFKDNKENYYQGVVAKKGFEPALEMMRFFTGFGVGEYNNRSTSSIDWADSVIYKQDITDLLTRLSGRTAWVGAYISTFDKNGHNINLELTYHPMSKIENNQYSNNTIIPLFNTLNFMENSGQNYGKMFLTDTLEVDFNIPKTGNYYLRYISTGHGGWSQGDEFNKKINRIILDDKQIMEYIPWNSDCATYRNLNPATANFWNGVASSDLSRSGWTPGKSVNPLYIPLLNLTKGSHKLKIFIPMGKNEGKYFSHWNISGTLIEIKK